MESSYKELRKRYNTQTTHNPSRPSSHDYKATTGNSVLIVVYFVLEKLLRLKSLYNKTVHLDPSKFYFLVINSLKLSTTIEIFSIFSLSKSVNSTVCIRVLQ